MTDLNLDSFFSGLPLSHSIKERGYEGIFLIAAFFDVEKEPNNRILIFVA
jgi:hypothetical protein